MSSTSASCWWTASGSLPFDEVRLVAHALEELLQLVLRDAGEEAGVGDLVAVEVQDRQHAAVAGRVEELVAVPAGGERPGLGLAVADDAGDDQVRVVERGPVGVAQGVAELAALVDAAGRLRGDVAGDAAGEAELLEQPLHPLRVLADVRVDLAVGAFEVGVGDQRRPAVPRADDVDHVQVIALDDPVEVHAEHVQARRRAPVAEQPRLDVLALERLAAGAGCRAGRSGRPTGSWRPASRRPSCAAPRRRAGLPPRSCCRRRSSVSRRCLRVSLVIPFWVRGRLAV